MEPLPAAKPELQRVRPSLYLCSEPTRSVRIPAVICHASENRHTEDPSWPTILSWKVHTPRSISITPIKSPVTCVSGHRPSFCDYHYHTEMSGCTLRFERNSPLRTTLVDEATRHAKYRIETPMKVARSVTRITKFESPTRPPLHWDEEADSSSGNEQNKNRTETGDEMARIYWKWFSPSRIIFKGRVTTRSESLPKCGKLKGWANLPPIPH